MFVKYGNNAYNLSAFSRITLSDTDIFLYTADLTEGDKIKFDTKQDAAKAYEVICTRLYNQDELLDVSALGL